ncbi:MAG: SCO family protein [Betaproteobacteria bacterium]|nr:SCO family protein [Betaproteobacteria bacterium]
MRKWTFCLLLLAALLAACTRKAPTPAPAFNGVDLTGAHYAQDFQLTDFNGRVRRLSDFRGKVVVLLFGYTHCPDVCPTTLTDLALAMRRLGGRADQVQVVFVTVDPARDSPRVLKEYVPAFYPSFLGLYGTPGQTAATARAFHVFYRKHGNGPDYSVDHSAGCYVYDRTGKLRLYLPYGESPKAIAQDLSRLLGT